MAKKKTLFVCQHCGYETSGWMGKCPGCQEWNSLEEVITVSHQKDITIAKKQNWLGENQVIALAEVKEDHALRFSSGIKELDRVLGGGFVVGSLVLVGGDPGIGKSTLLLQVSHFASTPNQVLYVSGEESQTQIKLRSTRLQINPDHITLCTFTELKEIAHILSTQTPNLCIIDSIQTIYSEDIHSAPGSVSQVREVTASLLKLAKHLHITIVLVGHVTKDGSLAGPRVLEHMVDTVLYFEGDNSSLYRILRAVKNRFGATGELAFFEMTHLGLEEVSNPSTLLLSGRPQKVPGSTVTATLEGSRGIFIEIQALVNPTAFAVPQRMAQGIDRNRLSLLLAIAEKHFKLGLNNLDVYINVVGGLKITETACDLAVIAAIISAIKDKALGSHTLVIGEVGLTGELRPVSQISKRLGEAKSLGFTSCILPSPNKAALEKILLLSQKGNATSSQPNRPETLWPEIYYGDTIFEAMDILFPVT